MAKNLYLGEVVVKITCPENYKPRVITTRHCYVSERNDAEYREMVRRDIANQALEVYQTANPNVELKARATIATKVIHRIVNLINK